jgi:hypothetical protein
VELKYVGDSFNGVASSLACPLLNRTKPHSQIEMEDVPEYRLLTNYVELARELRFTYNLMITIHNGPIETKC